MGEPKTIGTLGGATVKALQRAAAAGLLPELINQAHGYLRESDRLLTEGNTEAALWAARCAWLHASWLAGGAVEKKTILSGRKVRDGGSRGGKARSADKAGKIIAAARAYRGELTTAKKEAIANKLKCSRRYVNKVLKESGN